MKTQDSTLPRGPWEVRRRIKVPGLFHAAEGIAIEHALHELQGVRRVVTDAENHQVLVRYDARQSGYGSIAEALENSGYPPLDSWWSRIKANWYQFSDTNARDNAKAPPPACCNKPPK